MTHDMLMNVEITIMKNVRLKELRKIFNLSEKKCLQIMHDHLNV